MKDAEAASLMRSSTHPATAVHDLLASSTKAPKRENVARRSPAGGAHEASRGGTGIGPEDTLSALSQTSQESVPDSARAVPVRAAIAAQAKGSRNSAE